MCALDLIGADRRLRILLTAVTALTAIAGFSACGEGGLSIRLLLPESEELSPTSGEPVAEIALEARSASGESQRLSRSLGEPGAGLELGSLIAGDDVIVSVELRSTSQLLLGYGQTAGAIEIRSGESTDIELNVRRPLAYLTNQPGSLATFDASRDLANTITPGIGLTGTPVATTCTPDGGDLLVALESGGVTAIGMFSTSTHLPSREVATGLAARAVDLAITSDMRFAVVAHAADASGKGGITIVDIDAGTSRFIDIGPTRRIAIDSDSGEVFALVNASVGCGSPPAIAQIAKVSLGDSESGRVLPYAAPASDIALNPMSGKLLVADPCAGKVVAIDASDTESLVFDLEGVSAVAISDDTVFASGVGGAPLRVRIASVGLDGLDPTIVELPTMIERSMSLDFEEPDQSAEIIANADAAEIIDLAAVPGSDRVAVLSKARYDIMGDRFAIPDQSLIGWEYHLVDISTGSEIQRVRTRCQLTVDYQGELLADWKCGRAPDQQTTAVEFEPETLSILYGAR